MSKYCHFMTIIYITQNNKLPKNEQLVTELVVFRQSENHWLVSLRAAVKIHTLSKTSIELFFLHRLLPLRP